MMKQWRKLIRIILPILIGMLIVEGVAKEKINLWQIEVPASLELNKDSYIYQSEKFPLSEGDYVVGIDYVADLEGAECELYAPSLMDENGKKGYVLATEKLDPLKNRARIEMHVENNISEFQIRIFYKEGNFALQGMAIRDMSIYRDEVMMYIISILTLLIVGYLIRKGNREQRISIMVISVASVVTTIPYFNDFLIVGHDIAFHLNRIEGMYEAVSNGEVLARINPIQNMDYGYASGIMYPQFFLYIAVILRLLHVSLMDSYKVLIFCVNVGTAICAYKSFKGIFQRNEAGWLGCFFYTFCNYRLVNMYTRAALGELLAMAFLPVVIWGFYECIQGNYKKWYILMLGISGVIQSHLLSLTLCVILGIFLCITGVAHLWRDKIRIVALLKAVVVTGMLNLWTLVPILDYIGENFHVFSEADYYVQERAIYVSQLFNTFSGSITGPNMLIGSTKGEMILSVGVMGLISVIVFIAINVIEKENVELSAELKKIENIGNMGLEFGILFCLMASWLMPWDIIRKQELVYAVLKKFEFPWRFLAAVAVFLTLVFCAGILEYCKLGRYQNIVIVCALAACIMFAMPVIDATTQMSTYGNASETKYVTYADIEYLYHGDDYTEICDRGQVVGFSDQNMYYIEDYKRSGSGLKVKISGKGSENNYIELPVYYYPDYHASLQGKELQVERGKAGSAKVILPNMNLDNDELNLRFEEKPLWKLADMISVFTALIIIGFIVVTKFSGNCPSKNMKIRYFK